MRMLFIEAAIFSHRSRHFEQAQVRNTSSRPVSTSSRCRRLEETNDAALRTPLLNCDGLGICIQCDPAGGVAKEFLCHLDICSVCSEQRRIRVPESVPSDVLCDADLSRCRTNNGSHEALPPIRFLPSHSRAGEHPIIGGPIPCVTAPCMQCLG